MRYWLYKCNSADGGPAGYRGDWLDEVFTQQGPVGWGGHYSTTSPEVAGYLDHEVSVGDVIVAYQTDDKTVVGFCRVDDYLPRPDLPHIFGSSIGKELQLQPLTFVDPPFPIHEHKAGTILEDSIAVNGPVMLRELDRNEMNELVRMTRAPKWVLKGTDPPGGWKPPATSTRAADPRIEVADIPGMDGGFLITCFDPDVNQVDVLHGPVGASLGDDTMEELATGLTLGEALRFIANRLDEEMKDMTTVAGHAEVPPPRGRTTQEPGSTGPARGRH